VVPKLFLPILLSFDKQVVNDRLRGQVLTSNCSHALIVAVHHWQELHAQGPKDLICAL
jgi:hypothetical protein